jgi:hypothetical protein
LLSIVRADSTGADLVVSVMTPDPRDDSLNER